MDNLVFNLPNTILLIAIVFGLVFASVLIFRNIKEKNAHFWLGIFLLTFSFCLMDTYLRTIHIAAIFPPIKWTYYRLLTLIPFTIWIYISYLVTGNFEIKTFEKILISAIVLEIIFRICSFFIGAMGWTDWVEYIDLTLDSWFEMLIITLVLVTIGKSLQLIKKYQKRLENNYAEKSEKDLKWLSELLLILLIVTVFWILVVPVDFFYPEIYISGYWIFIPQAFIIFYFVIKGHLQPEIFHEFPLVSAFDQNAKETKKVIHSAERSFDNKMSTTKNEYSAQILRIEQLMESDKIYQQPKLSLQDMARKLNMGTRQLSTLINQHYQCSFSDFINRYRVQEVKEKILVGEHQKLTILAIAFDAGFNSKSSFNSMFKKFTGKTPMQFKNALNR